MESHRRKNDDPRPRLLADLMLTCDRETRDYDCNPAGERQRLLRLTWHELTASKVQPRPHQVMLPGSLVLGKTVVMPSCSLVLGDYYAFDNRILAKLSSRPPTTSSLASRRHALRNLILASRRHALPAASSLAKAAFAPLLTSSRVFRGTSLIFFAGLPATTVYGSTSYTHQPPLHIDTVPNPPW